jgi:Bacterial regulatory protein, Fis family
MKHEYLEAKTKSQMAKLLGISLRTFQRRLMSCGLNVPRGLISGKQQLEILVKLGFSIDEISNISKSIND